MERNPLNILITRPFGWLGETGHRFGPAIRVRQSYSEVSADRIPHPDAPLERGFPAVTEIWDENAINSANRRGAFVNVYPVDEMRAFVAELRAVWGDIHVQDNSGLLPDLHQGQY